MEYRTLTLSIPVALYATTQEGRAKELEWLKKAILIHVKENPDEMMDGARVTDDTFLSPHEYQAALRQSPEFTAEEKAAVWASDPRGGV